MKSIFVGLITVAIVCFLLIGCWQNPNGRITMFKQRPDTDVTTSPEYKFASFGDTVWKTKVKEALANGKRYNGWNETALLASANFDPRHPKYLPELIHR